MTVVMMCSGIFFIDGLGWVGLGYENWTHGHVWVVVNGLVVEAAGRHGMDSV